MNLHKETYVRAAACTLVLLFSVAAALAQTVEVNIKFDISKGKHNDSKVAITRDGKEVKAISPAKARLIEVLEYGSDYILTFEKPGYITKRIAINTRNVPKESQEDDLGFDFAVEIFQQYDGLNTVVFNQPVARYYYDPKEDAFTYDTDYTKSIRAALTAFEQEYTEQENNQIAKETPATAKAEEEARKQAEARAAEEQRKVEEALAKAAEEKRIEQQRAEERQQQLAEEARAKAAAEEAKRKAEAERQENEASAAREREEQERRAAEARMAEEKQRELSARMAEEQRLANMKAEEEARAAARMQAEEDKRKAAAAKDEAEARRTSALKDEEEARARAEKQRSEEEAQRASAAQMEEEAKRKAARQKAEEEARKLAEADLVADEQRKQEALAKAEEERKQKIAREKAMLTKNMAATPTPKVEVETKPAAPAGPGAVLSKDRRTYREGKKEVTEVTVTHERATILYKKVQHDWGGLYFFVNENSITKREFENRTGD